MTRSVDIALIRAFWLRKLGPEISDCIDGFLRFGHQLSLDREVRFVHSWWVRKLGSEVVKQIDVFLWFGVEDEMLIALLD